MVSPTVCGYAARSMGDRLEPLEFKLPELGPFDICLDVTHCGLCYTDIHAIEDYYGITKFPFVPGHEIVGLVTDIGSSVRDFEPGQRVGAGWQGRCCGQCEWCQKGEEHLCIKISRAGTWEPYGGFATSIVVDSRFAYHLADEIDSEIAAVLMCAGVTVYSALRNNLTPTKQHLGIIGMGGLGHLAIQFAHHLGYAVTVVSGSPEKKAEALSFGADDFMLSEKAVLRDSEYIFDSLLCTTHGEVNPELILDTLKKKGRLILVGFPDLCLNTTDLVAHELSICGSFLGSRAIMREMLTFAGENKIKPRVELMPMTKINEAVERLRANKPRYRIVLTNQ